MKVGGLADNQLKERSASPSSLSLLGLVRHMAEVERGWFRNRFLGEEIAFRYFTDNRPNDDFDALDSHPVEEVFADWRAECDRSGGATGD